MASLWGPTGWARLRCPPHHLSVWSRLSLWWDVLLAVGWPQWRLGCSWGPRRPGPAVGSRRPPQAAALRERAEPGAGTCGGLVPAEEPPHATLAPTCAGGAGDTRAGGRQWCRAGADGSPLGGGLGSTLPCQPGVRARRGHIPGAGGGTAERGPPGAALVDWQHPGPGLGQPPGWGCGVQPWGRAGQSWGGAGGPSQVLPSAHRLCGARAGMGTSGWPRARRVGDGDSAQWDRLAGGWSELCALREAWGCHGFLRHCLSPCVRVCCPHPCPH